MNILIFESNFSKSNIEGWVAFIKVFKNDYKLFILTETKESKQIFNSFFADIKCISINESIKDGFLSKEKIIQIYNNYRKSRVFFERLSVNNSKNLIFYNEKDKFEEQLSLYIDFIENFIFKNNISKVMMSIVESYQSYVYSIIESVANINKKECLIFQHPILRGFVYNNQLRYSDDIYNEYLNILQTNLSNDKKLKVIDAINAYKKYLSSDSHFSYLYEKKSKTINFKSKLKNYINNYINKISIDKKIVIHLNEINHSQNNYSILLLNKFNNYRNNKFSPFYSLTENLIRNISLSLPFGHILLIKLHPHDNLNNIFIRKEISDHHNIRILHSNISLNQILPLINLVFSQSTTSSLESLMYYKHLIMFGENLQFFGTKFDVVHRVINFEKLPDLIHILLNTDVDKEKINKFFLSLFSKSFSRDQSDDNAWSDYKLHLNIKEIYIKAAITLKNKLENSL